MDISKFAVDSKKQVSLLELRHPISGETLEDEKGKKATITLNGPDSDAIKKVEREYMDRRLKEGIRRKKVHISVAQIEEQALEIDVAATVGWSGIEIDGEDLKFSPAQAKMIYKKFPWIREQVEEFFNDRSNFMGK